MERSLVGRWRITGMELWDQEALDLVEPAFIRIDPSGTGLLGFIAVLGTVDCRLERVDGVDVVEFSWEGDDEGSAVSGRGRASLSDDGEMQGRIYFHFGDDSWFVARRVDVGAG